MLKLFYSLLMGLFVLSLSAQMEDPFSFPEPTEEEKAHFKKVEEVMFFYNRAQVDFSQGKYKKATEGFIKFIDQSKDLDLFFDEMTKSISVVYLARSYAKLDQKEQAMEYLEKALDDPFWATQYDYILREFFCLDKLFADKKIKKIIPKQPEIEKKDDFNSLLGEEKFKKLKDALWSLYETGAEKSKQKVQRMKEIKEQMAGGAVGGGGVNPAGGMANNQSKPKDPAKEGYNQFEQAQTMYEWKRYEKAAELYLESASIKKIAPKAFYNASRCYAKLNKTNKAIECLEKAIEAGFDDLNKINQDKDFDPLRDNQEFKNLVDLIN